MRLRRLGGGGRDRTGSVVGCRHRNELLRLDPLCRWDELANRANHLPTAGKQTPLSAGLRELYASVPLPLTVHSHAQPNKSQGANSQPLSEWRSRAPVRCNLYTATHTLQPPVVPRVHHTQRNAR